MINYLFSSLGNFGNNLEQLGRVRPPSNIQRLIWKNIQFRSSFRDWSLTLIQPTTRRWGWCFGKIFPRSHVTSHYLQGIDMDRRIEYLNELRSFWGEVSVWFTPGGEWKLWSTSEFPNGFHSVRGLRPPHWTHWPCRRVRDPDLSFNFVSPLVIRIRLQWDIVTLELRGLLSGRLYVFGA